MLPDAKMETMLIASQTILASKCYSRSGPLENEWAAVVVINELDAIRRLDSFCIVGGSETHRCVFPCLAQRKRIKMVPVSRWLLVFF